MANIYTVISQRETSEVTPDGRFRRVMEVTFETASGVTASVQIPIDRYAPETVDAAIQEYAGRIEGVAGL